MKIRTVSSLALLSALLLPGILSLSPSAKADAVVGQWEFKSNFNATIGKPLTAVGPTSFTTLPVNGQNVPVAFVPVDSYFIADHGIAPVGAEFYVNRYSLIMDIFVPSVAPGGWVALFQTNTGNSNDGDCFVRDDLGIGISQDYVDEAGDYTPFANPLRFTTGAWKRIIISIDTTSPTGRDCQYRVYVDGKLQNVVQSPSSWGTDGRFSLDPTVLIFADNDGETSDLYVHNLQMRDYAVTDAEASALGGPTVGAIDTTVHPKRTLSGLLDLGLVTGAAVRPVLFEVRPVDGAPSFYRFGEVNNAQGYTLPGLIDRPYNVWVKNDYTLSTILNANLTGGDKTVNGTLTAGDATGDNIVNFDDFQALADAYFTQKGVDAFYNVAADFNGDDEVNFDDFQLLADGYFLSGPQ